MLKYLLPWLFRSWLLLPWIHHEWNWFCCQSPGMSCASRANLADWLTGIQGSLCPEASSRALQENLGPSSKFNTHLNFDCRDCANSQAPFIPAFSSCLMSAPFLCAQWTASKSHATPVLRVSEQNICSHVARWPGWALPVDVVYLQLPPFHPVLSQLKLGRVEQDLQNLGQPHRLCLVLTANLPPLLPHTHSGLDAGASLPFILLPHSLALP